MSKSIILTNLKTQREALGITQSHLAELCDLNTRTIQRIESGTPTSLNTAKSISSILELDSYASLITVSDDELERCRAKRYSEFLTKQSEHAAKGHSDRVNARKQSISVNSYEGVMLGLAGVGFLSIFTYMFIFSFLGDFSSLNIEYAISIRDLLASSIFIPTGVFLLYSGYTILNGNTKNHWIYNVSSFGLVTLVLILGIAIIGTGIMLSWIGAMGFLFTSGIFLLMAAILPLAMNLAIPSIYDREIFEEMT